MHRGYRVFKAAVTAITARVRPSGTHVYEHRVLSVDEQQDELPAISVDYGEDRPATYETINSFDSMLSIDAAVMTRAPTESELHEKLWELREEAHIALMETNGTLGLDFVITTVYGPVSAPEVSARGEQLVGVLRSNWLVHYRMNRTDPGDP